MDTEQKLLELSYFQGLWRLAHDTIPKAQTAWSEGRKSEAMDLVELAYFLFDAAEGRIDSNAG